MDLNSTSLSNALEGSLSVLSAPHPIAAATGGLLFNAQPDEMDLDIFTNRDLLQLQQELAKSNKLAALEVVLFDRFLNRVQPGTIGGTLSNTKQQPQGDDDDDDAKTSTNPNRRQNNKDAPQNAGAVAARDKKKKNEKSKDVEKVVALSTQQKAEIASKEFDERKYEIDRAKEEWEKDMDNLKVDYIICRE